MGARAVLFLVMGALVVLQVSATTQLLLAGKIDFNCIFTGYQVTGNFDVQAGDGDANLACKSLANPSNTATFVTCTGTYMVPPGSTAPTALYYMLPNPTEEVQYITAVIAPPGGDVGVAFAKDTLAADIIGTRPITFKSGPSTDSDAGGYFSSGTYNTPLNNIVCRAVVQPYFLKHVAA